MKLPSFDDVARARERLKERVLRTPGLRNPALDTLCGGSVLVKAESLQRTGSFKLRGATNALLCLSPTQRRAGVLAFSSGNHAQATACAASLLGTAATVLMPADAPAIKRESTLAWGARILTYDRFRDDREALARSLAAESGATLVPPFDDSEVIAGQGTLALELFEDAEAVGLRLEALLIPTSGGGLSAGSALAGEGVSPSTRVYAVEPEGWDDTSRSLAAGERVGNDGGGSALCDALLAPIPGALTFAINRRLLAGGLCVSESEVLAAMAFAFRHFKLVVEPSGAVALAALLSGKILPRGGTIGVVLSGGNVEPATFARALKQAA